FNDKLRTNLMYSVAEFDNDRSLAGWGPASFGAVERAQSFHANLIYSPFPKLDIGAEIGWASASSRTTARATSGACTPRSSTASDRPTRGERQCQKNRQPTTGRPTCA